MSYSHQTIRDHLLRLRPPKVKTGGVAVGTLTGTFVFEATSEDEVNELVRALPSQGIMQWKVTQLETFAQRADFERTVAQGLRAQKYTFAILK